MENLNTRCFQVLDDIISRAIDEDLHGAGDLTTLALVPESAQVEAAVISRGNYVVAGSEVAGAVFRRLDKDLDVQCLLPDGTVAGKDASILTISGSARSILTAERSALNFMQRMMGIASLTKKFVDIVKPYNVKILDTRKTTPTMRLLEKYAVQCGGGVNHRMGLYDMIMVKDNHRRFWQGDAGFNLALAVDKAREVFPDVPVEVEVETIEQLENVLHSSPDWILLDNMSPDAMKRCVEICAGRSQLEASGGITIKDIELVAQTGVDAISLGCLTHSVVSADLSLEII